MVYAIDFTYNDIPLYSFGEYIVAGFDEAGGDEAILSRSVNRSDITYDQPLAYDYGCVDEGVYSLELTIMKKSGEEFTQGEVRNLVGWLMSPTTPQWLNFTGCSTQIYDELYYLGRFVSANYSGGTSSQKIGVTFTFESTSPYGFTREYKYTIKNNRRLIINNPGTKVGKTILPRIEIIPTATGIVTIDNADDNIAPFSINVTNGEMVIVENHYCRKENGLLYPITNLNNYNWVTIKDGVNHIDVTGSATVIIKVRFYEALGI